MTIRAQTGPGAEEPRETVAESTLPTFVPAYVKSWLRCQGYEDEQIEEMEMAWSVQRSGAVEVNVRIPVPTEKVVITILPQDLPR